MGEWRDTVVGNLLHFSNGRSSPPRSANLQFPVYGSNGIIGSASTSNAGENTIIVGRVGSYCGSLYLAETKCWVTDNAIKANPVDANDAKFLFYLLQTLDLNNRRAGSGQPLLNQQILATIPAYVPEPDEQQAIAAVLSAIDDKIELNRRMNETLEASARALFRDWFVDFGPVKAKAAAQAALGGTAQNDGAKASLRGSTQSHQSKAAPATPTPATLAPEIWSLFPDALDDEGKPEGWEQRPLDQIAEFLNGLALQKFPANSGQPSLPVIKIAELRSGITANSNTASLDLPEKYIINDGDFLFSWSGSLLAKFWTEGRGALNQHLFKVSSKEYPAWFYSQWVWHHLEEFQMIAASKATTMGHIQRGHLTAAQTVCPPPKVLAALGETMTPLQDQVIANLLESRTLAQTRDMLLPKLMSGEIRVADGARAADDAAGVAR